MKLDILAFGAHPDDIELSCSGTLIKMQAMGHRTGAVDLTRGELGTRGTPELRLQEADAAAKVMGLSVRENLGLADGFFRNTPENQLPVIRAIRKYRPSIIICNAPEDRHPDHGKGGALVRDAAFLSGLRRIETTDDSGQPQEPWRPKKVFHYIQDRFLKPSFVVDITGFFEQKIESVKAYGSQFYNPESDEPLTYISTKDFWDFLEARNRELGHMIGVTYGEGFISETMMEVRDLMDTFQGDDKIV